MKLTNIIFKRKNELKKSYYNPFFISESEGSLILQAITMLNSKLNISINDFDRDEILNIFEDYKLGQGILDVLLKYFFKFKSKFPLIKPTSELRMWFYKFANSLNRNFFPENEHKKILTAFKKKYGLHMDIKTLKEQMFQDHHDFEILFAEHSPTLPEIISLYNYDILEVVLKNSSAVTFCFRDLLPAALIKQLFFISKKFNVYSEFEKLSDSSFIFYKIIGPKELIGKKIKYGYQITFLFFKILSYLLSKNHLFDIFIDFEVTNKNYRCHLTSDQFPLIKIPKRFETNLESSFDSLIEKQFYKDISQVLKNWTIQREADPIFLKNSIFIPDFKLTFKHIEIYIEIIGFWTESYLEKKVKKLKMLGSMPNLLLLIDNKLNFPLLNFPTFKYLKSFPLAQIAGFIRDKFLKPYQQEEFLTIKQNLNEINQSILQYFKNNNILYEQKLLQLANISMKENLSKLIHILQEFLNTHHLIFIKNIGILKNEQINQIQTNLSQLFKQQKKIPLSTIQNSLIEFIRPRKISLLLPLLGCKIHWDNFLEPSVSRQVSK
ncbi:MAG: DUF790 family protein [Promethearchaeota archaeon]